jgi:hypothetical protein
MRSSRHAHRTVVAALLVLGALLLIALSLAGPATASPVAATTSSVVRFQDCTLPQGQTVETVVVIHGDAVIGGTVSRTVVVLAGDATIESTAVVGARQRGQSSSVVVVDGHLTVEPGATVYGKTTQVVGLPAGGLARAVAAGVVLRPVGVVAGWWQLLFLPIVALVVSALFPQTTQRVGGRVRAGFWPSLGWGFVGLAVSIVLLVALAVTIVGLLVVVPAALVLVAGLLFCVACVAATIGQLVLASSARYRDNLIAAAVVGAILVSLVSLVPVLGGIAVFVATVAGFGAALTLLNEWRATRPAATPAGPAPPPGARSTPSPYGPMPSPGPVPPSGWTAAGPTPPGAASAPPPAWPSTPPAGWTPQVPPPGWAAPPSGWAPPYGAPGGWAPGAPPWWAMPPQAPGSGEATPDAPLPSATAAADADGPERPSPAEDDPPAGQS